MGVEKSTGTGALEAIWSREGKLQLGHCRTCDQAHHYPRLICPECGSADTGLIPATGRGRILSFTTTRVGSLDQPIIHAFVTLEEGVSLLTRITGADPEAVAIDAPVTVVFNESELGGAPQFVLQSS